MPLRLATFNLKDFFLPRGDAEQGIVEAKIANVAANLRRARADVVGLQEVGAEELVVRLVNQELADLGYGPPIFGSADQRGIRNAILSRLPVTWQTVHTTDALPFPSFVEGDGAPFPGRIPLRRGIVHIRVRGDTGDLGEVDVMTCHFKSNRPRPLVTANGRELPDVMPHGLGESAVRSLVERAAEALYVRKLVDDSLTRFPARAICLMGDLNDTAESLPVRIVRGVDATNEHALHSCVDLVPLETRFSNRHGDEKVLIDHVLVSARLKSALTQFSIQNEALRYHGPHASDAPPTEDSDHALCVAQFG